MAAFKCLSCSDVLSVEGICQCGCLNIDNRGKAFGKNYTLYAPKALKPSAAISTAPKEKTKIRECPYCDWKGLVVPRIKLGCPEHGVWWYKPSNEEFIVSVEEEEVEEPQPKSKRGKRGRRDKPRREF